MEIRTRRFALMLPLLLALTACAGGDKYPFPPQFVDGRDVAPSVLPTPPEQFSATYTREINGILKRQAALSAEEKSRIANEDHIRPRMIVAPVLGEAYSEETHPALFTLLRHAASDAWRLADAAQDYWGRDRPWVADKRVELLVSTITRPSYPSGHTVTNHVWAHVLSELFPKNREALFKRAYEVGTHRIDAGVHYPSDVVAGKKFAAIIFAKMRSKPEFKRELAAARAELKANKNTTHHDGAFSHHTVPETPTSPCVTPEPGAGMSVCH